MQNNRNPGLFAIAIGIALGVLFALLGFTGALEGRLSFGLASICVIVAILLYIFFARGNAITRGGYAALVLVLGIGLIIPVLMVNQQQAQATETNATYDLTLHRGAALFGQYCATCHGYQGQGIKGPRLNNNPAVNKFSDDDIRRIISAGIPLNVSDPAQVTELQMPSWSQRYGGPLTDEDISYLLAFIRSSDKEYLQTKGLPSTNGFGYVLGSLTNPTQIADYKAQEKGGSKPSPDQFKDFTSQNAVTIDMANVPTNSSGYDFDPPFITVKVGTTVTWVNKTIVPHNVFPRQGTTPPDSTFKSPPAIAADTGTWSFTFTKPGEYPYYCAIHPAMLGWVTVVA
ncbi:MAG TPA: plastocyanin/azurin family copper-binding protein [Ktedonobacterales bacterium]|nr:plastocyanin/azurin family copper-binding protein [Ktedonobacterales bacterium]